MKKLILFISAMLLLALSSCGGIKSSSKGLDNQSFIAVHGSALAYSGGVDVNVDDAINFKAEVTKYRKGRISSTVYAIKPGKHIITVSYNGEVLYKKQVFLSNQETREIHLP